MATKQKGKRHPSPQFILSASALAATAFIAACDGGVHHSSSTMSGVVASSAFVPGSTTEPTIKAGYYKGALVCIDANNNGKCDASENPVTTDSNGAFTLTAASLSALIADIGTSATNTATNTANPSRTVFTISKDQVTEQGSAIVISSLSTEVARLMNQNGSSYATEKQNLATRISVNLNQVVADVNSLTGDAQTSALKESNALSNRYAYATTKLDRADKYPDALAVPGGNPELVGLSGTTLATQPTGTDPRTTITFQQAQQAAFNIEGIPRYDHIFIVMLENKATSSIKGSAYAPKINGYMTAGNQATSYYATGNPSEPNYTALGGADDFGITDDSQWNCDATGANAPQDLPLPTNAQPGLAKSPFAATVTCAGTNHNIVGKPNLFNAITAAGMTWRTYSESMNPGQDFRTDSVADSSVMAQDNVYQPNTVGANAAVIGNPNLSLPLPAGLYKTKHHPGMAYQNVRSEPDFKYNNRTLGGGQWDNALKNSTDYAIPAGYDYDQLSSDLESGNVGNLNFIVPDQCDDMHGISVTGKDVSTNTSATASDCSSVANNVSTSNVSPIITRGDNYVDYVVKKIQASALWKNKQKKVAIVLMFDEGNATGGVGVFNSCCGWNAGKVSNNNPLKQNPDGTWSPDTAITNYGNGNKGHGESIYVVLNNQPSAPKGVADSDAYSHFAFVRTLQDMFQLADPAKDASYMNRSKYTEKFIAQNILNLPEFTSSADTHFDSVRPMNHAFVPPSTYTQKQSADVLTTPQTGPDVSQSNIWAVQ